MIDFRVELKNITDSCVIARPAGFQPIYDYGVCGILEDFIYERMDQGDFAASFNYLDFACDGITIQGCMTITIMQFDFTPEVFTFLYEKELNTCGWKYLHCRVPFLGR